VTVNGVTISIDPSYYSQIYGSQNGITGEQYHIVMSDDGTTHSSSLAYISGNDPSIPSSITGPLILTPLTQYTTFAEYYQSSNDVVSADIQAAVTSLTVRPEIAAVPEPSTWAMMIMGFFGVALMTYRQRKNTTLCA
jgi:hypothetical protein